MRALLLMGAVAVLLGLPTVAQAATHSAALPAAAASVQRSAHAGAAVHVDVTVASTAPSGGVCSVPGIGDIGGLLGFCAQGSSGIIGDLNNICQPSVPTPESATGGIDALIRPPGTGTGASGSGGHQPPHCTTATAWPGSRGPRSICSVPIWPRWSGTTSPGWCSTRPRRWTG